ncbi:MAG: M15 family metallopeptidase [Bacteroidetes bacterium]|nr:M15 family metallopeptidase [Bacteroidota bacterium]
MRPIRIISLLLLVLLVGSLHAQQNNKNPYNLNIISTKEEYTMLIRKDSLKRLVDLQYYVKGIIPDIRYATSNNFTHKKVYTSARAFARLSVARALELVQARLAMEGLGLKIFDAYRPYAATLLFWELVHDTAYVASPSTGSRHNRGCAVDVTLVDLKTGKELVMPTPFDDFTPKAGSGFEPVPDEARQNRELLIKMMGNFGFTVYPSEWWHFDFRGWQNYELMDLSFEALDSISSH